MAKIFEQWVPAPIPGKAYLEIEDETIKYGFAPAGIELSILERQIVRYGKDEMDIWLKGGKELGVRIGLREISGNCALVKLQTYIAGHRNTIWEERVCW